METNAPTNNHHHRTVLTEVQGWIPLIDHLVDKYDLITAAVFGRIWRYSQMRSGVCRASIPTIATDLGLARSTVRLAVVKLTADNYLEDLTPGNHGRVHVYRDTGKCSLASKFYAEIQEDPTPPANGGVAENLPETPPANREHPPGNGGYPSGKNTKPLRETATNHKSLKEDSLNHNGPSKAFDAAKEQLKRDMPKAAYQQWVDSLQFVSETHGLILLQSPTDYAARWCSSRVSSTLTRHLTGILNKTVEIVITSADDQP